jgi:protease-4
MVVVASLGNVAASGGYYIACAADKIVAHPNSITGSIGVYGTLPNAGELLNKKLGITTDVVKTNKHSDMPSITRQMSLFERDLMQHFVENSYDVFITRVADGRNLTKEAVDEIGEGRVWTGEKALEIGLVDELGGLETAIKLAAEMAGLEQYRTVDLPELPDPFQELLRGGADNVRLRILNHTLGESAKYHQTISRAAGLKGVYARIPYDIEIR